MFFAAVDHDHKLIYNYKWLFLMIPSLPSFSHPQGHWQFHRTKCDLNWPFDNFKSFSAEHQPPHRQLSSVPLLAWSTLLKLSAALRKSPVATQRNQAQDWLEKKRSTEMQTNYTNMNTKFLGNLQNLKHSQRFQCALGARPTGRYAARW